MITIKSQREIDAMNRAGDVLAGIHIGLRDYQARCGHVGSRGICP